MSYVYANFVDSAKMRIGYGAGDPATTTPASATSAMLCIDTRASCTLDERDVGALTLRWLPLLLYLAFEVRHLLRAVSRTVLNGESR